MKYIHILFIVIIHVTNAIAQNPNSDVKWKLRWSDEFNKNLVNDAAEVNHFLGQGPSNDDAHFFF